jgi:hypothetical protein
MHFARSQSGEKLLFSLDGFFSGAQCISFSDGNIGISDSLLVGDFGML